MLRARGQRAREAGLASLASLSIEPAGLPPPVVSTANPAGRDVLEDDLDIAPVDVAIVVKVVLGLVLAVAFLRTEAPEHLGQG